MKGSSLWKFGLVILAVLFLSLLTANTEQASANSALDSMIEIRSDDGEYDSAEAQAMIDRLQRVDDRILQHTDSAGVSIILMDMPLTELPEFDYLSGKVPRGWENTNSTWDEVPGAGGHTTAARIGYSDPGNDHSTINLELHEYGHAVDSYAAGFTVSGSDEFRQIMNREKGALFGDHKVPEYFDEPGEYFAEVFAMYYLGGDARSKLQNRAPETYEFISHLHNRLVTVDEVTGNTAKISWDEMDGAAKYEIYRNDEKIDETTGTSFTDEDLKTSTNYNYYIKPVDSSGDPLLTSYFRSTTTQAEDDAPEVDTGELGSVIEEAEAVSEEDRSPGLQSALENAKSTIENDDADQQQMDEAEAALSSAIKSNEEEMEAAGEESEEESTEESMEEETTGEAAEESSQEEETTEEPASEETEESKEEQSIEETEAESETGSSQAEASKDNTFMILLSAVLVILAIIAAILIWKRKK
ncbi:MAG TPA: hypothetical protein H9891_02675 [Candidatus Salinicoccus stercoripullorum]|uniref:ATLF-like domain-containing protein n=1 Tax=Candidatus Salinicoccus stercoripullorum TaxID=2838756 RepID=A0A9D1QH01_9STAP|nr:hypothetical protein [Candidatus Salinicoccus stercoripullorum]